jgi:plastocyanin
MRRAVISTMLAVLMVLTATLVSGPAWAAKQPVKLSGTVNVHGTKDVSKKSNATLEMELDNFYFGPTFVKAKSGETIEIELENEGSAPHTLTSDALGVDEEVAPGDSATVEITVPSSGGAFRFFCRFHQANGMQGAVFTKTGVKATN